MSKGGDPWRARVWREQGTGGTYADMDPEVRPDQPEPRTFEVPEVMEDYPEGASVRDVLAWVGEDTVRARYAFAEEEARDQPRSGVTAPLRRLLA
jgi:hypothetical protein